MSNLKSGLQSGQRPSFQWIFLSKTGVFALRNLLYFFLFFHFYRYLKDILAPVPFFLTLFSALPASLAAVRWRFRIPVATFFYLFGLLMIRFGLQFFGRLIPGTLNPAWDFLLIATDSSIMLAIIPSVILFFVNVLILRYPGKKAGETLFRGGLLFGLFFIQGNYQLNLYSHPAYLAIALSLFLIIEIVLLFFAPISLPVSVASPVNTEAGLINRKTGRRGFLAGVLLILPFLALLLIFIFTRYNDNAVASGGGLLTPSGFRFDFSDYVKLESEISLSSDLVLFFKKEGSSDKILLRRHVLSEYSTEGLFSRNDDIDGLPGRVPDGPLLLPDQFTQARSSVEQEVYIVNFDPSSLVGMNEPYKVVPLRNWSDSSFLRVYRVFSRVSDATFWELEEAVSRPLPDDLERYYTEYGDLPQIAALAREITDGYSRLYPKVQAIERYLQTEYYYSLKPGVSPDGDQLEYFLFNSRKGYCSYFAFSMTLLCRSLGIPARVAVGFWVDPQGEMLNFFPVRADMAHAWVEVYFGELGWIEFDPTSSEMAPGEIYPFGSMNYVEYAPYIEEILKRRDEAVPIEENPLDLSNTEERSRYRESLDMNRILRGAGFAVLLGVFFFWLYRRFSLHLRIALSKDPGKKTILRMADVLRTSASVYDAITPRETLADWAERVGIRHAESDGDQIFGRMISLHQAALYSRQYSDREYTEFQNLEKRFLQSVLFRLSLFRRILLFLRPRKPIKEYIWAEK